MLIGASRLLSGPSRRLCPSVESKTLPTPTQCHNLFMPLSPVLPFNYVWRALRLRSTQETHLSLLCRTLKTELWELLTFFLNQGRKGVKTSWPSSWEGRSVAGRINLFTMNFKALLFHVLGKPIKMLMLLRSNPLQTPFCIRIYLREPGGITKNWGVVFPTPPPSCGL